MVRWLNTETLLAAWESALAEPGLRRPLALLSAIWPELSAEGWAARTVGERDRSLLQLRETWFGRRIESTARCPACAETVEVVFDTANVSAHAPDPAPPLEVDTGARRVAFRLPTTADLLDVAQEGGSDARERLLARCVDGADALPADALDAVLEAMAVADPQADVQVALTCPACGHKWSLAFDIVAHLWSEIDDWAHRMLNEVHRLAAAHGWSEREILAMSALRRRRYLELLEG